MKSILSALQRSGLFFCFLTTLSLTGMQKTYIAPWLCLSCTKQLETHLDVLKKNPHSNNQQTIAQWEEANKKCQNCTTLLEDWLKHKDPEKLLQKKLALEKIERLLNKGMLFLALCCARGMSQFTTLDIPLNIFCMVAFAILAYEAFCNNPRHAHYND